MAEIAFFARFLNSALAERFWRILRSKASLRIEAARDMVALAPRNAMMDRAIEAPIDPEEIAATTAENAAIEAMAAVTSAATDVGQKTASSAVLERSDRSFSIFVTFEAWMARAKRAAVSTPGISLSFLGGYFCAIFFFTTIPRTDPRRTSIVMMLNASPPTAPVSTPTADWTPWTASAIDIALASIEPIEGR
jgi:hypothetical protein